MSISERMKKIYEVSRARAKNAPGNSFDRDMHAAATGKYASLPLHERIARSMADAILAQKIYIDSDDRIFGRVYYDGARPIEKFDNDFFKGFHRTDAGRADVFAGYDELHKYQLVTTGSPGHVAWGWNAILRLGTDGIRESCERGLRLKSEDEKAKEFYTGAIIMLDALEKWSEMHAEELDKMGMSEAAEICRRVPKYPARSFREAVQSFFFQHIVVMKEAPHGGNSPGRLDYYLWPYLEADLKNGVITLDEAEELIEELFLRIDERIFTRDGWGESVVVGGCHTDGRSAVNPLSYVMIRAFMKYDITHPYFYIRLPKDAPRDFVELTASYIKNGQNRAQVINDEAVIRALVKNGVSLNDAADYYCGGCMEVGIQGRTSDLLFNGYHNITKLLEFCITGGRSLTDGRVLEHWKPRSLDEFDSFENFYNYFISQTKWIFTASFRYQDKLSEYVEEHRPNFLLSTMIDDCLARGRNMHGGGARYHDYGSAVIGLPNAADSLYAIKRAVFEDKFCTASELIAALSANFEGYELLRKRLMKLPKYGQENAEADGMAARLAKDVSDIFASYVNRHGGGAKPVLLSFIWAPAVGKILGATADGRLAGMTVAQSVTPQSAAMTKGITAAMNSCNSLPFDCFSGGASAMWDLDPEWASESVIEGLLLGFFAGGGHIFQGNATSVEDLIRAKEHPNEYPNLIVRVGGFSARFVNLDPALQDDIIGRLRHNR